MNRTSVILTFALLAAVYFAGVLSVPVVTVEVPRDWTPAEIELLSKAIHAKFSGRCL